MTSRLRIIFVAAFIGPFNPGPLFAQETPLSEILVNLKGRTSPARWRMHESAMEPGVAANCDARHRARNERARGAAGGGGVPRHAVR